MSLPVVVGIIALLAVAAAYLALQDRAARRRRKAAAAWAREHDWTYADNAPEAFTEGLDGGPFGRGHDRQSTEAVWGVHEGRRAASWRYAYTLGRGRYSHTVVHRIVAVALPAALPRLELTAEGAVSRAVDDLELEDAAFNDSWRVRAEDERVAYAVLHPRMMERLKDPGALGRNLLISGDRIVTWHDEPGEIWADLALLTQLVDLVPGFVWADAEAAERTEGLE